MHSRSQKQAVNTGKFPECSAAPCSSAVAPCGAHQTKSSIQAYPRVSEHMSHNCVLENSRHSDKNNDGSMRRGLMIGRTRNDDQRLE